MRRSWWTLSQFDWSLYKGRSFRPQRAAHVRGVRIGGGEDSEKACVCRLGREASEETNSGIACFRALCCKGPPPARPEYDLVCIGLTGSGKTSLLSKLCSENPDSIVSTTGFSIKAVPFQNAILNVKELGGYNKRLVKYFAEMISYFGIPKMYLPGKPVQKELRIIW
ncbi:ADP-ribosylation factor-like protein 15 isoform X5 [Sus scrofa]|uniref:ADP-ribosylation factor-like protein 15 isoform X5 n=1 Tax=Sus scrofa TaxID=9823 RepID=UPI000A2B39A3|nr:ADP-ribosylation factor-like protein 15 isoform X5 [Sus scrofa]